MVSSLRPILNTPAAIARPIQASQLEVLGRGDGFEPAARPGTMAAALAGGAGVGALAVGFGTRYFEGPTEVLFGMFNGSVVGATVGGALGAVVATAVSGSRDEGQFRGSIGSALVGGALGSVGGLLSGALAGAYIGNGTGNLLGFAAGAALGAGATYLVARNRLSQA